MKHHTETMLYANPITADLPNSKHASDGMLLFTAILGLIIAIAITILGKIGKQLWMQIWGIGLFCCSAYLGYCMW